MRGNLFCIFFLFKCLPFQPMEELVNFFIQTAGCKSPEFINTMTRARLHQTVRNKCSTFRNSPIWSALRLPRCTPLWRFTFRFVLYRNSLYWIKLYFTSQWDIYGLFCQEWVVSKIYSSDWNSCRLFDAIWYKILLLSTNTCRRILPYYSCFHAVWPVLSLYNANNWSEG